MEDIGLDLVRGGNSTAIEPKSLKKDRRLYDALRRIAPLRAAVRWIRGLLNRYRVPFWFLEGVERESGAVLRILYAGQLEAKNYIAHLAFSETPRETRTGKAWLWRALRWQPETAGASLVIVDVDIALYSRLCPSEASSREQRRFLIPCWVRGDLDLAAVLDRHRQTEKVLGDLRKIRRNRLEYTVTRDPNAFERFYFSMYLPYMSRVYGDRACLMSYEDMQQWMPKSELFVIGKDGEDMAADILVYHDDGCVQAWSAGVKDGDTAYVKAGALAALYYFRAQHLLAKKHSRCDVGLSRPFLKDGVLQYKNKWGLELTSHNDKLFVLKFSQDSAGTRAFMRNNPFIYLDGQRLQGAVFRDPEKSDDTATLERLRKDYHISGMAGLRFFD